MTVPGQSAPVSCDLLTAALCDGRYALALELFERPVPIVQGAFAGKRLFDLAASLTRQTPYPLALVRRLLPYVERANERAFFLYHALDQDRPDILIRLLEAGVKPEEPAYPLPADAAVLPMLALKRGSVDAFEALLVRRSPVRGVGADGRTVLHELLATDGIPPERRAHLATLLIEDGVLPERCDAAGESSLTLARRLGMGELAEQMARQSRSHGPRWAREARAAGIRESRSSMTRPTV